MRIPRAFLTQPLTIGDTIELPPAACEHLVRVLRLREGASLLLCNGDGSDYQAQLVGIGKRSVTARILDSRPNHAESTLRIVLAQALARGDKMDWVVQKATELGVDAIEPIVTERTEVRLDAERAGRRLAHWQGVAIAACEQCGRSQLPRIVEPVALDSYLARLEPGAIRLALDPDGESLAQMRGRSVALVASATIHVVVGPEGGLSHGDAVQLRAAGFIGWRLGPRILRTETAGLVALATLQSTLGDLR